MGRSYKKWYVSALHPQGEEYACVLFISKQEYVYVREREFKKKNYLILEVKRKSIICLRLQGKVGEGFCIRAG